MTLAESQALFHALLEGGPAADPERLEACFAGTPELPAAERVGIYAGMFLSRQVDALRASFPRLAALLGEERFEALCGDYLAAHPSEHHDIGRLGRRLPAFLRLHPDPGRPELPDLAELERARDEVFFEAEAAPAPREALAALPPEAFAAARLRMVPALRLLALAHDAAAAWRGPEGDGSPPARAGPVALAVWRTGFEVVHGPLDADEGAALASALAGEPLAAVCAAFEGRDDPGGAAASALASWLAEGWIAAVEPPPGAGA